MRALSLFSGYTGLDMAVTALTSATLAGVADNAPGPAAVLARHHPNVLNHGDMTRAQWGTSPVDVLTAGYPCQGYSHAGKRLGADDRRYVWPYVHATINHLQPGEVYLENVRGHLSLGFDKVLADLTDSHYDTVWTIWKAGWVGAPHHRARLFMFTFPRTSRRVVPLAGFPFATRTHDSEPGRLWQVGDTLFGPDFHTDSFPAAGAAVNGALHSLPPVSVTDRDTPLLPTPMTVNRTSAKAQTGRPTSGPSRGGPSYGLEDVLTDLCEPGRVPVWGAYEPAIRQWERTLGRDAPPPVEFSPSTSRPRLSARFAEWMMGLPDGWVSDTPDLAYSTVIELLGNGVVPQQATAAYTWLRELTHPIDPSNGSAKLANHLHP